MQVQRVADLAISSGGRLQRFPGAVCVQDVNSPGSGRKGEEDSCWQVGGGSGKGLLLALEYAGEVELEARRRWAVTGHHCRPTN